MFFLEYFYFGKCVLNQVWMCRNIRFKGKIRGDTLMKIIIIYIELNINKVVNVLFMIW